MSLKRYAQVVMLQKYIVAAGLADKCEIQVSYAIMLLNRLLDFYQYFNRC